MTTTLPPPYPLAWPEAQRRTASKAKSAFRTGLPAAIKNVQTSLRLFAEDSGKAMGGMVVTCDASMFEAHPKDSGVAIWFVWDGDLRCIAVDRFPTLAENLQAIHHVIEARRTELRYAGIEMARTAFRGFIAALPAPGSAAWWTILGVSADATPDQITAAYRAKARELGATGNEAARTELNVARDKGLAERTAQ